MQAAAAATPTSRCASHAELGTRREIKNPNSFKFMQQAIDYEVRWQIEQIEGRLRLTSSTYCAAPATPYPGPAPCALLRTYRYFPDLDLPPLMISRACGKKRAETNRLRVMATRLARTAV
jgi:aspartyl-tRNA(Asn)/glutamyl-tRNA(Gln) amidotransferase subunit B